MQSHITPHGKRDLPKLRDSVSFLYLEYCNISQDRTGIIASDVRGEVQVPAASLSCLLLGPGTTVSHAAVKNFTEAGCSLVWVGEHGVRTYANSTGETNKAYKLIRQAQLASDDALHMRVVERMYRMRFKHKLEKGLDLRQIRGMEGIRVRTIYQRCAKEHGLAWEGRNYDRTDWKNADPLNRALSVASSCLNGICHAAVVSAGYSTALGFVHSGKQLSFVYDIADLYKMDIAVPVAFAAAAAGQANLEGEVRKRCRDAFRNMRLLERIVPDLERALDIEAEDDLGMYDPDNDPSLPTPWWEPQTKSTEDQTESEENDGNDT
jgi:CRISP-associated protein Cas1